MYQPPRPRAVPSGETGSPLWQVPQGLEDLVASSSESSGRFSFAGIGSMSHPGMHALGLDGRMPQERASPEKELADYMTTGAMDSGSYFTDLLRNYVEESQDFTPVIDTSTEHTPAAGKGSQGRTKNFRDEEDKLLVSAWLNIAHACALFKAEDRKKRKFALMHCWRILKDKPKWLTRRKALREAKAASNKKPKRTTNSSPSSDAPSPTPDNGSVDAAVPEEVSGRLDGKKEKQKLRQRSTIEALDYLVEKMKEADGEIEMKRDLKREERCNKAFALQEERNKLEREKFELKRELEEERILSLDLSNMTSKQQQNYEEHQNEFLARCAGSRLP
ncbi:hypothetical protein QOZ80_3AG0240220 [Eleusine coracana subsp. coracana]|nr:hypothetical protein QOZ80_3AG0240220 [Eleusine coracana subsp. coracana]